MLSPNLDSGNNRYIFWLHYTDYPQLSMCPFEANQLTGAIALAVPSATHALAQVRIAANGCWTCYVSGSWLRLERSVFVEASERSLLFGDADASGYGFAINNAATD